MKENRLARVRQNMEKAGLSRILVSEPASVYYLTGHWISPGERMLALLITADGEEKLFANKLFALPDTLPLVEFTDDDDPITALSDCLGEGTLGVDKTWPSLFSIRLMERRPDIRLTLGSAPVDRARMCKDAEELYLMAESSRMNDQVMDRLLREIHTGITEQEVGARYSALARELGAEGDSFEPLICFGAGCAEPHHATGEARLEAGQTVILDVGLKHRSYCSDMTRTVCAGKADEETKRVYDLVKKANEAGRAAVRPGVPLCEVDKAARSVIEAAGYGAYFIHRTGHGIGLTTHEPPDVSASSNVIAEPGMVFSVEPGIYLPGRLGVRIEDLVAVTEDGAQVLNSCPRDLMEL